MASKPPDYEDICRAQGAKPVSVLQAAFSSQESALALVQSEVPMTVSAIQDIDFRCLFLALEMNLGSIREISISGYALGTPALALLTSGLAGNETVAMLTLDSADIGDIEGVQTITRALAEHQGIISLSLTRNRYILSRIDDAGAAALAELLETTQVLRALDVSSNKITSHELAIALSHNASVEHFAVNDNPLSFEALIAFLELLSSNRTLQVLEVEGCPQTGPAPLKENSSGHLSKSEAVILVLSYVLRYSTVRSLAVDIDVEAEVQLQELEGTVIKHNRSLIELQSRLIDPATIRPAHPLHTIYKALKANKWLADNEELPREQRFEPEGSICDLVTAKQRMLTKRSGTPDSMYSGDSSSHRARTPDIESTAKIRIEDYSEEGPKTVDTPHFTTLSARKRAKRRDPSPPSADEEELISQAYGVHPAEHPGQALERETKIMEDLIGYESARSGPEDRPRDTEPDKSLISASVFADTPRNFLYSESSPTDTPFPIESPRTLPAPKDDLQSLRLLVSQLMSGFQRLEGEVTKSVSGLTTKVRKVEERVEKQADDMKVMFEFAGSLEKSLKVVEERFEVGVYRQKSEFEQAEGLTALEKGLKTTENRLLALETKENAKIKLFEMLGNDMDVSSTQSLRASIASIERKSTPTDQFAALERRLQPQIDQLQSRIQAVQHLFDQTPSISSVNEIREKVEDLMSIREGKEEEVLVILNKLTSLEGREEQLEKLKYFVSMLQKDLSTRLNKVESRIEAEESTLHRQQRAVESRLVVLEETSRSSMVATRGEEGSLPSSPPLTGRLASRSGSVLQVSRLEERVADLEKDQNNVAFVKKRLIETMVKTTQRRVKSLEKRLEKRTSEHICDLENEMEKPISVPEAAKGRGKATAVREEEEAPKAEISWQGELREDLEEPVQPRTDPVGLGQSDHTLVQSDLMPQARSDFSPYNSAASATKLNPDQAPESLDDRIARLEKLHIHKKALLSSTDSFVMVGKEEAGTKDSAALREVGNGYLPGEAESLIMSVLLERTQKGKPIPTEIGRLGYVPAYRALSPLSGSFTSMANYSQGSLAELVPEEPARDLGEGPSLELQEYLRTKGFCFPEGKRRP